MRIKHLCVLIHIRNKVGVCTVKHVESFIDFSDSSKAMLLLWIIFVIYVSCLTLLCCLACYLQPCEPSPPPPPYPPMSPCWEKAGLLNLLCVMFSCVFVTVPLGVLGQVWYLIGLNSQHVFLGFSMHFTYFLLLLIFGSVCCPFEVLSCSRIVRWKQSLLLPVAFCYKNKFVRNVILS